MKQLSYSLMAALALVGCAQAGPVTPASVRTQSQSHAAMVAAVSQGDKAQFRQADADGDGSLSPTELAWMPAEAFRSLDADKNGQLSFTEAIAQTASAQARAKEAQAFAEAAGGAIGNVTEAIVDGEPAVQAGPTESEKPAAKPVGNPIVLVPGYLDMPFFFNPITKKLRAQGYDVTFLNLFPNITDIRNQSAILDKEIKKIKTRTRANKVDVIGHSMGGLITRYYIKEMGGDLEIERLIQLATPNHGTIVSYLGPSAGAAQMHPGSDFLNALNATDETPGEIKYTSIRGGLDEIVIPHDSPILDGATNQFCRFAAHGSIFIDPSAWKFLNAALKQ